MLYIGQYKHINILFYDVDTNKRWGAGIARSGSLAADFIVELTESISEI